MNRIKHAVALSVFTLALGHAAYAATYDVTNDIDGNSSGQFSWAIGQAHNGDTIEVESGAVELNNTNYVFNNNVTIENLGIDYLNHVFNKSGTGTVTLTEVYDLTQGMNVLQGRVDIAGNDNYVDANITVSSGATLGGTADLYFFGGQIVNNGIVSPGTGTTPATLTVTGNYTANSGSTLQIYLTPTTAGRLTVSGTATLNGADVTIAPTAGSYTVGHTYTILSAGSLSGAGLTLTDPTTGVGRFELLESGNSYEIEYLGNATHFAALAMNANQRSVGGAIDRISTNATGAYSTLFTSLAAQSTAQQQASLEQLNGSLSANMQYGGIASTRTIMNTIQSRLGGSVAGGGTEVAMIPNAGEFRVADADDSFWGPAGMIPAHLTAWMQGFGEFDSIGSNSTSAGINGTIAGGAFGVENHFDPDTRAGVSFAAATDSVSLQGVPQSGTQNTYALGLYGSKGVDVALSDIGIDDDTARHLVLDGTAMIAYNTATSTRGIGITGETAHGETDGYSFGADLGAGYPIALDEGSVLTPHVGLSYTYNYENGYTESGAPIGGLTVNGDGFNMLQSSVGATIKHSYDLPDWRETNADKADIVTPEIHAAWQHEILNPRASVTEAFSGLAGSSFNSYGAAPDRDSAALGIGASYVPGDATQVSIYARYDAVVSGNQDDQMITGGFKYSW